MIRKSAYGRTQLFLPSSTTIIREVKCMGGVTRYEGASVYHALTKENASVCWHCCEEIAGDPIPLPRTYDAHEGVYHVYGAMCSPECAKAYIVEHTTFDKGHHIGVLTRMLREVYGVTRDVREAPPRACLRRFGGLMRPEGTQATCRLVTPPFVSYCMIAAESADAGQPVPDTSVVEKNMKVFEAPKEEAMFTAYVAQRAPPVEPTKRKRKEPATGGMAQYVKRPASE
jgi:hypothetical protein